jgi:hypothetical protein
MQLAYSKSWQAFSAGIMVALSMSFVANSCNSHSRQAVESAKTSTAASLQCKVWSKVHVVCIQGDLRGHNPGE